MYIILDAKNAGNYQAEKTKFKKDKKERRNKKKNKIKIGFYFLLVSKTAFIATTNAAALTNATKFPRIALT